MGLENRGWILLGSVFRCRGVPEEVRPDLEALLRGFPRADGPSDIDFEVSKSGDSVLTLEDGRGSHWEMGEPVSSHLEYRLVNTAIERARDRWVLHAGAVAAPRGTCLLVGESGAGKTSLTLWLWASGLTLVTDDLCPVLHGSLSPETFPRALHMDCEYSPRLLEKLPPRPASYPADYYPFPGQADSTPPPFSSLLVIERGPRPEGEIEPLGQSEAAHHLLKAVIKSPSFEFGQALSDMLRLSGQIRASRLRSSTPEGAGEAALAWISGL
ncbi:MAG TPA: hypothetical protein VLQ45_24745 [Thermoanaerobaculia bacterium]|nr:hypothetical protein [Thermoanaerobaculia bacterium]